ATNAARVGNREVLVPLIQSIFLTRGRDEWLAELEARGIPAGPINTISEVFDDPQVKHRGMQRTLARGELEVPQVACPLRFDSEPALSEVAPPRLGQDSDAILAEMGLTEDDIARLRREGIVR
ncbi:MAG: CoA transferase, partial [Billgrantia desiderata]